MGHLQPVADRILARVTVQSHHEATTVLVWDRVDFVHPPAEVRYRSSSPAPLVYRLVSPIPELGRNRDRLP
jgi:hypothetical protein